MTAPRPSLTVTAWPALMDEDLACAYLCVSRDTFRVMCGHAGVRPVDPFGLRMARWRKADLDAMVDSLPLRGASSGEPAAAPTAPSAAEAALERAMRRNRR